MELQEAASSKRVVMSCFAGRRSNIEVLLKYADVLKERGLIHEFHLWNFARNDDDDLWLQEEFGEKMVYAMRSYDYISIPGHDTLPFTLDVRAARDVHILVSAGGNELYEIVLGGWSNRRSIVRTQRQGQPVLIVNQGIPTNFTQISVIIEDGCLCVHVGHLLNFLKVQLDPDVVNAHTQGKTPLKVMCAGWDGLVVWRLPHVLCWL